MNLKLKTVSENLQCIVSQFLSSISDSLFHCQVSPSYSDMFVPKHTHSPKSEELDEMGGGAGTDFRAQEI